MCEPATLAASAMAVSTGAQMYGQREQYKAAATQAKQQDHMYHQNVENTRSALAQQYGDINRREVQEGQATREQQWEISQQARAEMASARVAAGESGVSGLSVSHLLRDISGSAARDRMTVGRNFEWSQREFQSQRKSARVGAQNQINSVQRGQAPSKSALAVGMVGSAADGFMNYQNVRPG